MTKITIEECDIVKKRTRIADDSIIQLKLSLNDLKQKKVSKF